VAEHDGGYKRLFSHPEMVADLLPGLEELRRSFALYLVKSLLPARVPGIEIPEATDLQEVKSMLAESAMDWTQQWKQKGSKRGSKWGSRGPWQRFARPSRESSKNDSVLSPRRSGGEWRLSLRSKTSPRSVFAPAPFRLLTN